MCTVSEDARSAWLISLLSAPVDVIAKTCKIAELCSFISILISEAAFPFNRQSTYIGINKLKDDVCSREAECLQLSNSAALPPSGADIGFSVRNPDRTDCIGKKGGATRKLSASIDENVPGSLLTHEKSHREERCPPSFSARRTLSQPPELPPPR